MTRIGRFWRKVLVRFWRQRGTEAVAILAYTSLIGIVPLLAVMLSIFSSSSWFEPFQQLVMQQVVAHLMPDSQPAIQQSLTVFAHQASGLAVPGLVVMFITTLMLLWTIDQKINAMWDRGVQRSWWHSLLNYLGVSLIGPILLGAGLVVSTSIIAWPLWFNAHSAQPWVIPVIKSMPFIFSVLGFMLLYKFVPARRVSWHQAWLVGLMAAVQIEILKLGFAWYVIAFPTYDLVYGALAAVPLFLLWLYLMWFIVIWNACVLSVWGRDKNIPSTEVPQLKV